jgi:hypothetical protein
MSANPTRLTLPSAQNCTGRPARNLTPVRLRRCPAESRLHLLPPIAQVVQLIPAPVALTLRPTTETTSNKRNFAFNLKTFLVDHIKSLQNMSNEP